MKLEPIQTGGTVLANLGELPPEAQAVLQATAGLYDAVGFNPPWICYIAVRGGRAVGTCGFKSPPADGRVEIAYFTFPAFEGRGVATSMAGELIQLATRTDPRVTVAAQTLPERNASHRILEKHGFTCMGAVEHPEDGTVLEWRRDDSRVA
jgi:RimJ/RimL family protein N-acetyltransferase